jgi:hypothetical protein
VVRGPSPLLTLALAAVAVAWTLVAPVLPSASSAPGVRVAAVVGAVLLGAVALTAAWLRGNAFILATLLLGSGLLALASDATHARAAASVPEAVMWATLGMGFARRFAHATLALGVGGLVAGLALAGLTGATATLTAAAAGGDPLTLELPALGGGQAFALPALLLVAVGAVGTWTVGLDLRGRWTALLVVEALALAVALRIDPVAPVLLAFLVVNADRLAAGLSDEA